MKKILLTAAVLFSAFSFGQKEDLAMFIGANYQKVSSKDQVGLDFTARYYLTDQFSLGGQFLVSSQKYWDHFGYFTDHTQLNNFAVNVVTQYDIVNSDKVMAGFFVGNGVKFTSLKNLNDTYFEEHYDEYGYPYYVETAKTLNRDTFYVLTPGVDLSVKLATIDKEDNVGLYLTAKAGYQLAFGNDDLQRISNPHTFTGSFGLTFKGSTKSID